jgi:hypothetical protein
MPLLVSEIVIGRQMSLRLAGGIIHAVKARGRRVQAGVAAK